MRLTDLVGSVVVRRGGARLGHVHDVRLVQNGPLLGVWGAALSVDRLLVGPNAVGVRLGYGRNELRGPWLIRAAFEHLHPGLEEIPWASILAIEPRRIVVQDEAMDRSPPDAGLPAGRIVDAGLALLDRQILDPQGRMAGNVDDVTLSWRDGPGTPYISEILTGPGALARRLGGRLGRWTAGAHERLQDRHLEGPASIGFGIVSRLDQAVHVTVDHEDLPTYAVEAWVRKRIVDKIPGA